MTTKTIIVSLIIVVAICVVVFEYFHKKHAKYTEDELKQFTIELFAQKGDVDLHIVVLGIGFIPPQLEDQILLGEDHFPAPH